MILFTRDYDPNSDRYTFRMDVDAQFLAQEPIPIFAESPSTAEEWMMQVIAIYKTATERKIAAGDHTGTTGNGEDDDAAGAR